jgi:hypothetical protein
MYCEMRPQQGDEHGTSGYVHAVSQASAFTKLEQNIAASLQLQLLLSRW